MKSNKISPVSLSLVASAIVSALALPAQAAENRAQRYTPGLGGTDMTTMLVPGWYGQVAMIHYHANKLKDKNGDDTSTIASGTVPGTSRAEFVAANVPSVAQPTVTAGLTAAGYNGIGYTTRINNFRADAYVALPRVTYITANKFLGAHVGFTAMVPLVRRQTAISALTTLNSGDVAKLGAVVGAPTAAAAQAKAQAGVNASTTALGDKQSDSHAGLGDLEFAPLLNWEIGDHQTATFTPTLIVPTGQYDKNRATNPGFGKFYTFRPSFQYGFIGDGWDVGARMVLSFNTKNKDTNYKSGTMFNVDFAAMKFVTEDLRVGLQGYVVNQLTKDSSDDANVQAAIDAADGTKMRAYAAGPALGWIVNGGEMVVEGKLLKEFGARNRSEGTTYMLMLSKPFGL